MLEVIPHLASGRHSTSIEQGIHKALLLQTQVSHQFADYFITRSHQGGIAQLGKQLLSLIVAGLSFGFADGDCGEIHLEFGCCRFDDTFVGEGGVSFGSGCCFLEDCILITYSLYQFGDFLR